MIKHYKKCLKLKECQYFCPYTEFSMRYCPRLIGKSLDCQGDEGRGVRGVECRLHADVTTTSSKHIYLLIPRWT
jgi:hypothetical protein